MTSRRLYAVLIAAFVGCAGRTNDPALGETGAPRGPCYQNGTCNAGLSCVAGTCLAAEDGGPPPSNGGAGGRTFPETGGVTGDGGFPETGGVTGDGGFPESGGSPNNGGTTGSTGGDFPGGSSGFGGTGVGGAFGGAAGAGGAQPGLSVECGQSTCNAKQLPVNYQALSTGGSRTALACCSGAESDRCGLLIDGSCVELGQPGTPNALCRGTIVNPGPNQASFAGCCKPDGTCGFADTAVGLGCFFSSALSANPYPDWCAPDAGAL